MLKVLSNASHSVISGASAETHTHTYFMALFHDYLCELVVVL